MVRQPDSKLDRKAAKPTRWRWLRRILYGVAVFTVLVAALLALAGTGPVLRLATPTINRAVSAAIDGRFELGKVRGSLWTALAVESFILEMQPTGLQVEGRELELVWSPFSLFGGVVQVDRLAAGSLSVVLPREAEKAKEESESADGFSLPLAIRLGQLSLPHLSIVDPKSGRQFLYQLDASGAAGKHAAELALALVPLDAGIDRLRADLAFDAGRQELHAEIDGYFDRAGIVMTLAGLRPEDAADVTVLLKGRGPAEGWQGELDFAAGDWAELSGTIGLQLRGEQLGFTFSGAADTLGGLAGQLPEPLQGEIDIGLAGQFDLETSRLALTKLDLAKPDLLTLSASADLDLEASRLVADLQAKIDAAASGLLEDAVQWQWLELTGHAEGDLAMPDVTLTVGGRSVATPVSTIGDLSVAVSMAAQGDRYAVLAQGTALQNDWSEADLAAMLGDRLDVTIHADVAANFSEFLVDKLEIAAEGLQLTGRADLKGNRVSDAGLQAEIDDLSILTELAGLELRGNGRVTVDNAAWDAAGGGQADIDIAARQLDLGQADLNRLVGPQPAVAGQVKVSPQMDLGIRLDRLETAMADGAVSIDLDNEFKAMTVRGELAVKPGAIPPAIAVSMPQAAHAAIALDGPPGAPAGDIRLTVPVVETAGERFEDLELTTSMNWSDEAVLSLLNRLDFALRGQPYRLEADVILPPDRLQLANIALNGEALDLTGQLELPGYQMPMAGDITLSRLDAGLLGNWGAPVTAGQLDGRVDFVPLDSGQRLDIDVGAKALRLADVGGADPDIVDRLTVRGHIDNSFGDDPVFDLRLDGTKIVAGQAALDTLQATVQGALSQMRATVEARGQFEQRLPVSLAASADIALEEDIRTTVDRLDVQVGSQKIALRQPLQLERTAAGVVGAAAALSVGREGRLDLDLRLVPAREFDATADLRDIALEPWGEMFAVDGMTGTLSLTASLNEQAGQKPRARIDGDIGDIRIAHAGQLPPLRLQLDGNLSEGRVKADLSLGRPDLRMMKADAEVPLTLSILEGRAEVDPDALIAVHADIDGEISQFWPYLPLPDHVLDGKIKLAAELSGSLAVPAWEGVLTLQDGRYEHLQFGTLLSNIQIDGRFDQEGLRISEITADDGGKGRLTGKAEVELDDESLAYRAEITMRDMAVTRMDELRFWADIDLNMTGDGNKAEITGNVSMDRGEVDLAVAFPESVPQLDVENLRQSEGKARQEEKKEQDDAGAFAAELDMKVDIPGLLFVRGKGLDSEWAGSLDITGTADDPRIVGELLARRGQFDVIGKTFVIRDSKIAFFGGRPPDPLLDIVGVHTAGNLTVTASLAGHASKTKLTLSSDPVLPQEEILSRVLFGKSQGSLSTVEALQLASVAAEMSGVGGGLDVLGSIRKFLKVDVLRVEGGEEGPEVEVGKYLTEGVYVGTKRGATSGSSGVEVEIELTPNIKATSESTDIDNKAGIQFKWDY